MQNQSSIIPGIRKKTPSSTNLGEKYDLTGKFVNLKDAFFEEQT